MKLSRALYAAAIGLVGALSASATTVIPPTFEQLVGRAQVIFEGTVTDVTSQWVGEGAQRHIVSYVTLEVADSVKGDAGTTYTLRMLGGTVGDTTMAISDAPNFAVGERTILFVENNGTQFVPLVGIMHGRFRVQQDAARGGDVVLDNFGHAVSRSDLAELGKNQEAAIGGHTHSHSHGVAENAETAGAMSVADFKAAIRAQLQKAAE
jgi:hypothetical protein